MASYTTTQTVADELRATSDFTTSSYPSVTTVESWIEEVSDEIDLLAGRTIANTTYTELIDYDGEETITLKHAPVTAVTSVIYSTTDINSTTYSLSDTKVSGTDYTTYTDSGEIVILNNWKPLSGRKRIQVIYTAGYATIPPRIRMLATKMVTDRVLSSLLNYNVQESNDGGSVSVGNISIVEPESYGVKNYMRLKDDIVTLKNEIVGGFGIHRYGMRY